MSAIIGDVRCETCKYCMTKFGKSKCFVKKEYGETIPTIHWCPEYMPDKPVIKEEYKILQK